jgi:hypothetical protein
MIQVSPRYPGIARRSSQKNGIFFKEPRIKGLRRGFRLRATLRRDKTAWQAAASRMHYGENCCFGRNYAECRVSPAGCQGTLIPTPNAARFSTIVTKVNRYIPIVSPIAVCIAKMQTSQKNRVFISHEVRLREKSRSWECIAFRSTAFSPKATRGRVRTPKVPRLRDEIQRTKFAQARHGQFVLWRTAKTFIDSAKLPQRSSFFIPAFQLQDHAFDVSVVLVRPKELQAFLRIAPLQDFDRLLTRAPGIHLALVGHVKGQSCCDREALRRHLLRGNFVRWKAGETACRPASATNQPRQRGRLCRPRRHR